MGEPVTKKGLLIAETRRENTATLAKVYTELKSKLRADIKSHNLRLREVCRALEAFGYVESTQTLSSKLRSGKFSAAYYVLLTKAIDIAAETKY